MRTPTSSSRRFVPAAALGAAILALSLLIPAAGASAWVRETAPTIEAGIIQPDNGMTVLPDGTGRYLMLGAAAGSVRTNQLVVRPPAGPAAFASPFPSVLGQYTSFDFLMLSPADAAGNQLVVREADPFGVAFLAPGADPAAATIEPTEHITQIDVAPSGEAAAITSDNSEAYVSFRAAGPAGRFDAPRRLDRAGNMRSYGVGITIDPDGGVFVVYRTEQSQALVLQAYAPPGGAFGAPQQIDVPTSGISDLRYGQSTNGHGVLAWSEDVRGDTNDDQLWVVSRQPGGLLGDRTRVAEATPGRLVTAHLAAVTDDGTQYVSYLDANPVSGCLNNNDGDGGSVLAVRGGGSGSWAKLNEPTSWPQREDVQAISTAGNAVGVMALRTTDNGARCADTDPVSQVDVRLGQGASLGAPTTVASESMTDVRNVSLVRPRGFAVNAAGAALMLTNEPLDATTIGWFLYSEGMAVPAPAPRPGDTPVRPLPAPGRVTFGGAKLVARGGEVSFEASCTRLPGEGSRLFCSIGAILREQERRRGGGRAAAAHVAAARARRGRGRSRRAARPKVLAVVRAVRVPVGSTRTISAKLNGVGRRLLRAAGRRGLPVTLTVTIERAGYAPRTIQRNVKLVAGRARARGRRRRRGAGRRGARRGR